MISQLQLDEPASSIGHPSRISAIFVNTQIVVIFARRPRSGHLMEDPTIIRLLQVEIHPDIKELCLPCPYYWWPLYYAVRERIGESSQPKVVEWSKRNEALTKNHSYSY